MKIATWNVNSIKARMDHAILFLKEDAPDVLLLQETKTTDDTFPRLEFESLGYNLALHGQKTYNGVAIFSKHPITDIVRSLPGDVADEQARYIEAVINIPPSPGASAPTSPIKGEGRGGGAKIRVASVYVPNGQSVDSDKYPFKLSFLNRLRQRVETLLPKREMLIIGGDYNVAPQDIDAHNPKAWKDTVLCHPQVRAGLRSVMNLGLYDAFRTLHPDAKAYSWWDYRAAALETDDGLRIDHFLISAQALDKMSDCTIAKHVRMQDKSSDHAPVMLTLVI